MDAHEQQLVVSADARPSGQLAGQAWVRAWAQSCVAHPRPILAGCAASAADLIGTIGDYRSFATTGALMSSNRATRAAPIQYP